MRSVLRIGFCLVVGATLATAGSRSHAAETLLVRGVEFQPLASGAARLIEALDFLGQPFSEADRKALEAALKSTDPEKGVVAIQQVLDPHVLVGVNINPESRVKTRIGPARPQLVQQGWRNFLVKVHNQAGVTAELKVASPNAAPSYARGGGARPKPVVSPGDVPHRFLDVAMFNDRPLNRDLSGLVVEYRILQLYCRDVGKREATLGFHVGQGTQDIGFRNQVSILFDAIPATEVVLGVIDHDGEPTMGSFVIRDRFGRVHPSQARRLAPDFFFHPQVYRGDGESVLLPPGEYVVEYGRGPEYHIDRRTIQVPKAASHRERFELRRWIEPKTLGWYSGDHHVHAAGCSHYSSPTEGVAPGDMFRHILGEDLNVGCVLSWGPCWYFQKQYFDGKVSGLSQGNYIMRYDVEVSGFPSSHAGHLCLLNLTEDDFTYSKPVEFDWSYGGEKGHFAGRKTDLIGEWPSWDLPVLKWGKDQGGVVGFSHSGWGLDVGETRELPNYIIPPFNGIGANEYIVDVAHGVCDFISSVDTPSVWELNIWYHTLNCGFECPISGETDFPCIYGERVGLGRVYVKLDGALNYDDWIQGIKAGRSYVGDGLSHLIDFRVNDLGVGEKGSRLDLDASGSVKVTAKVAALLPEKPTPAPGDKEGRLLRDLPLNAKPYWHVERARIGATRRVPVEVIVNGYPVARTEIAADGELRDVEFDVPVESSSWIALRIFPSSHTNPVFVQVDGKPIRASKRSAQWCIDSVDQCWKSKVGAIRAHEREEAKQAFDEAKRVYEKVLAESARE